MIVQLAFCLKSNYFDWLYITVLNARYVEVCESCLFFSMYLYLTELYVLYTDSRHFNLWIISFKVANKN